MPRMTFPDPATMDEAQRRVHDKVVAGRRGRIVGPLRAALHSPELADLWQAFGEFLRYRTQLTPRQSELAILVTGRACRSPFEWHAHVAEARKAGIDEATITALREERVPEGLPAAEAVVVRYARELNRLRSVGDAVHAEATALLGVRAVVELTALVGYYTLVAMTLNAHEIPLPDGAEPAFPLPQHAP